MAKFSIEWDKTPEKESEKKSLPKALISTASIKVPEELLEKIGTPDEIVLGHDLESNLLVIKAYDDEMGEGIRTYPCKEKMKNGHLTIYCKSFIQKLRTRSVDLPEKKKVWCPMAYNSRYKMLVLDLPCSCEKEGKESDTEVA